MKETKDQMTLIDGCYDAADLREILGQLFSFKINFHNLVVHNMGQLSEEKRAHSARRIVELKQERQRIEAMIDRMESTGEMAVVKGTIHLELLQPEEVSVRPDDLRTSMK